MAKAKCPRNGRFIISFLVTILIPCIFSRLLLDTKLPVILSNTKPVITLYENFKLHANEEPVDALENFRNLHHQTKKWRQDVLANICAMHIVNCQRPYAMLMSTLVTDNTGKHVGQLAIYENTEPADAVLEFGLKYNLNRQSRLEVLRTVCESALIQCNSRAVIFSTAIVGINEKDLKLILYDDEEPVDQIYQFCKLNDLPDFALDKILKTACASDTRLCERSIPCIYSEKIYIPHVNNAVQLQIFQNDEPADVLLAFSIRYGISKHYRQSMVHTICGNPYISCNRIAPQVFSTSITNENGTQMGILNILEDEELADACYKFRKTNNVSYEFHVNLFNTLCGHDGIKCTRSQALLKSLQVEKDDGTVLGNISVFENQEPADIVWSFAQQHGLSKNECDKFLDILCGTRNHYSNHSKHLGGTHDLEDTLHCSRYAPIIFANPIGARNGSELGILEVLADEEPADAIGRFGNKHGLSREEKLHILKAICTNTNLTCTRTQGLVYSIDYTLPHGVLKERINFMDEQEPIDVIYEFASTHNLTFKEQKQLLIDVCTEPRGRPNCTRAEPLLLSIPVWESADKKLGDVIIYEGDEPVDTVYTFLEKHDLFQTAPLNVTLQEMVCNNAKVTCNRLKPRRTLFTMTATYYGIPHKIQYVRPENDWHCTNHNGGRVCTHHAEFLAYEFCTTHMEHWTDCKSQILDALKQNLATYEAAMWRGKNLYAKLGLVNSASAEEIDAAYNKLVKLYNNETEPQKYEKLKHAYHILSDPEEKYYFDLPCMKLFGCLCGKRQRDGGISITPD